jgi:hypothetical protein
MAVRALIGIPLRFLHSRAFDYVNHDSGDSLLEVGLGVLQELLQGGLGVFGH